MTGSNRRPPACKAGALPAELIPLCTSIAFALLRYSTPCVQQHTAASRALHCSTLETQRRIRQTAKPPLCLVGLGRLELPTPRLSSVCSNQLSYKPFEISPESQVLSAEYLTQDSALRTQDSALYFLQPISVDACYRFSL